LQLSRKQAWPSHAELARKLRTPLLDISKLANHLNERIPNWLYKEIAAILGDVWTEKALLSDLTQAQEDSKTVSVGKNKRKKLKYKYADLNNLPFDENHYNEEKADCVECSTYLTLDAESRMQAFKYNLFKLGKSKKSLRPKQSREPSRSLDQKYGTFFIVIQCLNAKGRICNVGYSSYTINCQTQSEQNVCPGEEEL
jgi:hypothetical protein